MSLEASQPQRNAWKRHMSLEAVSLEAFPTRGCSSHNEDTVQYRTNILQF